VNASLLSSEEFNWAVGNEVSITFKSISLAQSFNNYCIIGPR
jgi:hypothetical protein